MPTPKRAVALLGAAKERRQSASTNSRQSDGYLLQKIYDNSSTAVSEEHQFHAAWLVERQMEERRRSLIRRLEQLANDARNERLEAAAALLQATAEELRFALRRDAANGK